MSFQDKKIEALFKAVVKPEAPGACLGILHDGQWAYKNSWGLTNLENPAPLTTRSIFNMGSLAKQFTACCIFQLQQQRKLSLEDEARKFIPELPYYGRPLLLRHLLWHSSGLRCYSTLQDWAGAASWRDSSRRQALELVFRQKELNFPSGSECLYSNSNYLLLSEIVQRVSGKSLQAFAARHIFEPLGLKDTHFREDGSALIPNLVSGHFRRVDGTPGVSRGLGVVPGVGRLMSSLEDLGRWEQFFVKTPKASVPILRGMLTQGWLDNGQKLRFAGGLMLQRYRGLNVQRHDGWSAGCRSEYCRFPDQAYTFICLSNHADLNATWMARQAAALVFGRAMEPVSAFGPGQPAALPAKHKMPRRQLREIQGLYRDVNTGAYVLLSATALGLDFESTHVKFELRPESASAFQGQGHAAIYRLDLESEGGFILIKQGRASRFERVKGASGTGGKKMETRLEGYAGRYASPELVARVEIKIKGGKLHMLDLDGRQWPLTYVKAGHFFSAYRDFHFTKKGLTMQSSDGWVRRLKWVRL
jgi:CubicO group peptidase (beta-lactamase class C family)